MVLGNEVFDRYLVSGQRDLKKQGQVYSALCYAGDLWLE